MEKKKTTKKTSTKTTKKVTVKKSIKTATKTTAKKTSKKKKTKGFTLIELLAVIIILGVLMIIAIPSVTTYISNSRDNSYAATVQEAIGAARTLVNSGKLETYDRDTTYYIPMSCIPTENGLQTPYGEFDDAYILVTYNGDGYDYYFTGKDTANIGIKNVTKYEDINADKITKDIQTEDIKTNVAIDGRGSIVIFNEKCTSRENFLPNLSYSSATKEVGEIPIVFYFDGNPIAFENNMTWGEWLESPYNVYGARYQDALDVIYTQSEGYRCWQQSTIWNFNVVINSSNAMVKLNDKIVRNGNYHAEWWAAHGINNDPYGEMWPGSTAC